jgi:hypothetical protein
LAPFSHAIWRIVLRTKGADSNDRIGFVVGVCAEDRFGSIPITLASPGREKTLKAIARDAGMGYRAAQRWVMRYRKCGLAGLARNDRADRGRRRTITPALKDILEALEQIK